MLLRYPEAAKAMSISESQLYVLLKAHDIRSVPVGPKGRRIPTEEIEAWIKRKLAAEPPIAQAS